MARRLSFAPLNHPSLRLAEPRLASPCSTMQTFPFIPLPMGGIILQPEGGVEVEPGQSKAVVAEITDLDILNDADVTVEKFRGEADLNWINTVTPRYVEPGQKWTMLPCWLPHPSTNHTRQGSLLWPNSRAAQGPRAWG